MAVADIRHSHFADLTNQPKATDMNQPAFTQFETLTSDQQTMLDDVLSGLSEKQKNIPSKYFYDEEGSRIFDEITELEEYYPTRTEAGIMTDSGHEMAEALGENVLLVEYGSGSSIKTRALLDRLSAMAAYVPVDISGDYLFQVAAGLQADYPNVNVLPVVADFTEPFSLPKQPEDDQRVIAYFPGSTIGNFTRPDARRILSQMADLCGPTGGILIGVDLLKSRETLIAAYDDSPGVTARFNLNLLHRLNNELGADFVVDQFRHEAVFNVDESRIEIYLVSERAQVVCLDGERFHFESEETILTEYSHKYTLEAFDTLAADAGLETKHVWTDPKSLFSVQYLVPTG